MKIQLFLKWLISLSLFSSPLSAEVYVELSPGVIDIDTSAATTRPIILDARIGFSHPMYQLELAVMTSVKDDSLNELTVDIPSVVSVFFHYIPFVHDSLKLHLIAGASQVKVDSSYANIANSSDSFYGVSYGVGLEESFESMPQLKLSLDWIQLYSGDQLDISSTSLGVHYVF